MHSSLLDVVCLPIRILILHSLPLECLDSPSSLPSSVGFLDPMAALEAALKEKLDLLAEEKSLKMKSKVRLMADPQVSPAAIQQVLTDFLRHKETKNLWSCLAPPPTGPVQWGWHTHPQGDWMLRVSGLIYDFLALVPNTKLHSTKVVKAMKSMVDEKVMEVQVIKPKTKDQMIDMMDMTLRVLMNMVRTCKTNPASKNRVMRTLCKAEQVKLELILDKVVLPAEVMQGSAMVCLDEDEEQQQVDMQPLPPAKAEACLDIVPFKAQAAAPAKAQPAAPAKSFGIFPIAMPAIFGKILGKDGSEEASAVGASVTKALSHVPKLAAQGPGGKSAPVPKKKSKGKMAMKALAPSAKSKTVGEIKGAKKDSEKNKKNTDPGLGMTYQPGKMNEVKALYVKKFLELAAANGKEASKSEALEKWKNSVKRAQLLANVPLPELKKRRFVTKDCTENPFFLKAQQGGEDID